MAHPDDFATGEKMWRDTLAKGEEVHTAAVGTLGSLAEGAFSEAKDLCRRHSELLISFCSKPYQLAN